MMRWHAKLGKKSIPAIAVAIFSATFLAHAVFVAHASGNSMSKSLLNNSRRERQIIEVLYRLGEASVADVRSGLDDPPTYSTVRAMLADLVQKNQITYRQEGKRYLYRPKVAREKIANGLLKNLIKNFFQGRPSDAICAMLEEHGARLSTEDIKRIQTQIEQAISEKRDEQ
jgi:BlaI family transcriptional regulator, penicillinase repressor